MEKLKYILLEILIIVINIKSIQTVSTPCNYFKIYKNQIPLDPIFK
jgi:hypothetical protein